jgi:hypothetical protein
LISISFPERRNDLTKCGITVLHELVQEIRPEIGVYRRLAADKFEVADMSGAGWPEDSRIAVTRATKSPMTRFARSVSSLSRIGPIGSVAHMVLMQSRVRDNESTTANIGSIDGGGASGSDTASAFGPPNSITFTFCIAQFQIRTVSNARPGCTHVILHGLTGRLSS